MQVQYISYLNFTSLLFTVSENGKNSIKKLLDEEMWKAIEQGNINVANRVLELGAEPALKKDPKLDSDQSYDDWQHR